ncbi:Gfo/Idh/MocA family oxidoreductase [Ostreiculturibacter nitratireducens]|uniref:Gfo/Idh/MocA family protein n=1 Tax=Ostreiculturibacter nitratireducens TaxID=3075226 RepID=UPI0031B580C4
MSDVRFAVAGAGLIGKRHVEAIGQARGATVSAIVDPAPSAANYAAGLGLPYFQSLEEAFAARVCDSVFLATPNQVHVSGGLACIEAGIPVLVEKPLDVDVAAARRLVEAGEAAGVPILTGHHRRHNPLIAAAKSIIASGEIGSPVSVHAMFWLMKPDDYFEVEWRRQPGAGPVLVNLIHDLDLMRHLVGEVTAVLAMQSNKVRGNPVEETCAIAFEFEGGALGTANVSDTIVAPWSWELTTGENPAYPMTGEACYMIGGTHGAIDLPSGRVWSNPGKRSWWEPIQARIAPREAGDPLVRQAEQFVRVIRDGEAPLVSGREGLRTLELIDAIKRAAASGQRTEL